MILPRPRLDLFILHVLDEFVFNFVHFAKQAISTSTPVGKIAYAKKVQETGLDSYADMGTGSRGRFSAFDGLA